MIRHGLSLDQLKEKLRAEIDAAAETARAGFVTLNAGQALVYGRKLREAELILADPDAVQLGEVPHIAVEAEENNVSLFEAAVTIVTTEHHWSQASVEIERRRMLAKRAVDQAITPQEARLAAVIDWSFVSP
jgi:hypothetical protein